MLHLKLKRNNCFQAGFLYCIPLVVSYCCTKQMNLKRGSCWLCTQNPLRKLQAMTYETSKCQQTGNFSWFIDFFHQFHKHLLKNRTMLFPATFISTSKKIGMGLEKQAAIFYFNFTRRWVVRYSCFDFFQCSIKVFSTIWTMKYLFNITNKTHCKLCLRWNTEDAKFPKHLFRGLKYLCRIWLTSHTTPYGSMNPYGLATCFFKPRLSFPTQKWKFLGRALSEFSKYIYEIY